MTKITSIYDISHLLRVGYKLTLRYKIFTIMSYLGTTNNKIFERFGDDREHFFEPNHFLAQSPFRKSWLAPEKAAANLKKEEQGYHLQISLPGFEKEAIQVKIEEGILMVSAIKDDQKDKKEHESGFIIREFHQENMYRSFTLNDTIDENGITAKLENGVLHIFLPIKTPHQPKVSKAVEIG